MAIFGPKPWVNPFGKMSFFPLLELLFFYSLERRFFVLKCHKTHFPGLYFLREEVVKWPFLDQNYALTPLPNVNFSTFLTSCFYSLERRFFALRYRKRHFSGLCVLKKKIGKMAIFGPKPWVNPIAKCEFFDFLDLMFL